MFRQPPHQRLTDYRELDIGLASDHPLPVEGTPHATSAAVQHVRIDHRRADIAMPQQLLDRPDVIPGLEQMRRKRVPKRVTGRRLCQPGTGRSQPHQTLRHTLVQMMPTPLPGLAIDVMPRRWKHPLPAPLAPGVRILPPRASGTATHPHPSARSRSCNARTRARCPFNGSARADGSVVTRSFRPFPSRTRISRWSRSRSFTRSSTHSSRRNPEPYINDAISQAVP